MSAYLLTDDSLTLFHNDNVYKASASDTVWTEAVEALRNKDYDEVVRLVNTLDALKTYVTGDIIISDYSVMFRGQTVEPVLTQYILRMKREGFDITPMVRFLENLYDNPSYRSRQQLYRFLEANKMPLTEDGCFMAYKRVNYDWLDVYSQTYNNAPGQIIEMPREQISDDPTELCSVGLHVCALGYLSSYRGDKLVAVKVNPRDVVSVPTDYNDTKMRVCRYEVVGELPMNLIDENKEAWDKTVVEDDEEWEPEISYYLRTTDPNGNYMYYTTGEDWAADKEFIQYFDTEEDARYVWDTLPGKWSVTVEYDEA
jgi:hypothetical protein